MNFILHVVIVFETLVSHLIPVNPKIFILKFEKIPKSIKEKIPVAHWHLNVVPSLVVQIPPLKQGFAGWHGPT